MKCFPALLVSGLVLCACSKSSAEPSAPPQKADAPVWPAKARLQVSMHQLLYDGYAKTEAELRKRQGMHGYALSWPKVVGAVHYEVREGGAVHQVKTPAFEGKFRHPSRVTVVAVNESGARSPALASPLSWPVPSGNGGRLATLGIGTNAAAAANVFGAGGLGAGGLGAIGGGGLGTTLDVSPRPPSPPKAFVAFVAATATPKQDKRSRAFKTFARKAWSSINKKCALGTPEVLKSQVRGIELKGRINEKGTVVDVKLVSLTPVPKALATCMRQSFASAPTYQLKDVRASLKVELRPPAASKAGKK